MKSLRPTSADRPRCVIAAWRARRSRAPTCARAVRGDLPGLQRKASCAGNATMRVVPDSDAIRSWRVDLGIAWQPRLRTGLVGLNIEQSTVFDAVGDRYRPLTPEHGAQGALSSARRSSAPTTGPRIRARWTGDVKKNRRSAVPLQDGDMSALLINLAVIRDAAARQDAAATASSTTAACATTSTRSPSRPRTSRSANLSYDAMRVTAHQWRQR